MENTTFAQTPTLALPLSEPERTTRPPLPSLILPPTDETKPWPATSEKPSGTEHEETTAAPPESSDKSKDPTTAPPPLSTTKPPVDIPANLRTPAGVIEYFNKAANDVKKNVKRAYQTRHMIDVKEIYLLLVGDLTFIAPALEIDDTKSQIVFKSDLPVTDEKYGSRLQAAGVSSAICKIEGNDYVITIKIKPESGEIYQDNSYHGQVFKLVGSEGANDFYNIINAFVFAPNVPKALDFKYSYSNASITCRIDRKTGKMISSNYSIHAKIEGLSANEHWFKYEADDIKTYSYKW
jgi:hypothetical protein